MTFKEVLAHVIDWLQQDQRLSYRALKRQFALDDDYLEDLKVELIEVRQVALDQDGKINAAYGVIGLPTTFLVGRDGRAVALAIGPREWAGAPARAIIEALLAEPGARPDGR